jgi:hypothetical protein
MLSYCVRNKGTVEEVERPLYTLISSAASELYIHVKQDCIISKDELLFAIHGKFLTGQAATHLMENTSSWIKWDLKSDSAIMPDCNGVKTKTIPHTRQTMQEFLTTLEGMGLVRVKLHLHKMPIKRIVLNNASLFETEVEGVHAMQVSVEKMNTRSAVLNLENFYTSVSVDLLKKSAVVNVLHRLQVNDSTGAVTCNYPGVFLKSSLRCTKGQLILLSARPEMA